MSQKIENKQLKKIVKKFANKIHSIAHVGAHLGQEVGIYLQAKPDNLYLFEPQKNIFDKLNSKVLDKNNVFTFNFGLGADNSKKILHKATENNGASSSLLEPKLHLELHSNIKFENNEEVEVKRFDELNINDVNFLVLDVQGFELEVIKGFGKKMESIDFLFTEINKNFVYKNNVLIQQLDEHLNKVGLVRFSTFWDPYLPYGDAFYINKKQISNVNLYSLNIKKFYQDGFLNKLILRLVNFDKLVYLLKQKIKIILN